MTIPVAWYHSTCDTSNVTHLATGITITLVILIMFLPTYLAPQWLLLTWPLSKATQWLLLTWPLSGYYLPGYSVTITYLATQWLLLTWPLSGYYLPGHSVTITYLATQWPLCTWPLSDHSPCDTATFPPTYLATGVNVSLVQKQQQLFLRKVYVNVGKWNHVESEVPGGILTIHNNAWLVYQ